ncbi:Serine-threonine/tyrosine-protein kinase [Theobroma cacao]|nr:Serine-threonine/tyrosine-protein kinase [Theobroma cacao]
MTGGRGTPGYAAPELWIPYPITHKCDVYSFGMLLFEIIGRRRNLDIQLPESQEWFPRWVWENIENGDLGELMKVCEIDDINRETAERMVKTALWRVQYRPEQRPLMSMVVKMLEGAMEIPAPSNPFAHLRVEAQIPSIPALTTWTETPVDSESSSVITESIPSTGAAGVETAVIIATVVVLVIKAIIVAYVCSKRARIKSSDVCPDSQFLTLTMDKFLNDMEREKPIRFTTQQLRIATDNFTNLLGSGGFGAVYKGIFSNGTIVAVKVLHGTSDKRIEEQFMAEVSTIGRVHHFNLVRLYGFCFERNLRALVYEFMTNGSLDKFLFSEDKKLGFEKLHEIAVGTAKGIAYLHEECQQRIIHYDIKPGNILLDAKYFPKVADFGLAKLCNRENTHVTMTGGRGTPGYAAPELWMPYPITHKCDVYSFGMLLFEIIGKRRNLDRNLPETQEWFPRWVWKKIENGNLVELMIVCGVEEKDRDMAERMIKTALWCVQYRPESRPLMSIVVKMLEGALETPAPSNPFAYLWMEPSEPNNNITRHTIWTGTPCDSESSSVVTRSSLECATPIMRKYGIEMAST